ncbi:hypothetical protein MSHO_37680 [Mycobacterium shottsii]|uniref:Uncharacterized protein n=1 Tax=Mycobacterium shottsii TaxID=133549 RepID=A0A7I7LGH3_9MYCO|nr:hypothetical protein MSHO_37680 [Mycobacterium shottsii]
MRDGRQGPGEKQGAGSQPRGHRNRVVAKGGIFFGSQPLRPDVLGKTCVVDDAGCQFVVVGDRLQRELVTIAGDFGGS